MLLIGEKQAGNGPWRRSAQGSNKVKVYKCKRTQLCKFLCMKFSVKNTRRDTWQKNNQSGHPFDAENDFSQEKTTKKFGEKSFSFFEKKFSGNPYSAHYNNLIHLVVVVTNTV